MNAFVDDLAAVGATGLPDRFFDRFVFNLHPRDRTGPGVILGVGRYPGVDTVDGFLIALDGSRQRNLRFSSRSSDTDGHSVGPLRWSVLEPHRRWRVEVDANATDVTVDLEWTARTSPWIGAVAVRNAGAPTSSFEHLFQSGTYRGSVTIDGEPVSVDGWFGQRDRSRGVRTMSGGQGLHLWVQAQFDDRSIGFLLVEDRSYDRVLLEGAVMHVDGCSDPIVGIEHALEFDGALDLRGGRIVVMTEGGARYRLDVDASGRGAYMSGGGYGGQHGRPHGRDHVESDEYLLDGSVSPRTVDSALTDRFAAFHWDGHLGIGVLEFAHSRSAAYRYRPSAGEAPR